MSEPETTQSNSSATKQTRSTSEWLCSICHTNEYFPMMIKICGHTFCEDCLQNVNCCSICRMKFNKFDLIPNYCLVNGEKQPSSRNFDLDAKINDLVKIKHEQIRSQVNLIINGLLEQLHKQMIAEPEKLTYTCQIENSLGTDILKRVQAKLLKFGLEFVVDSEYEQLLSESVLRRQNLPGLSGDSQVESTTRQVKIRFVLDSKKRQSPVTEASTVTGLGTTQPITTTTTSPNGSTWLTSSTTANPNALLNVYDILFSTLANPQANVET